MIIKFSKGIPGTDIVTPYTVKTESYEKIDMTLNIKPSNLFVDQIVLNLENFSAFEKKWFITNLGKIVLFFIFEVILCVSFFRGVIDIFDSFSLSKIIVLLANIALIVAVFFIIKSSIEAWLYGGMINQQDKTVIIFQSEDEKRDFSDILNKK